MTEKKSEQEMIEVEKIKTTLTPKSRSKQNSKTQLTKSSIYNASFATLKEKLEAISVRPSTLYLVISYVMEEIEKSPIKGKEQKEMALKLIKELVLDFTEGADEKVLLQLLEDGTIGNLIDLIVDATNGKLNINAVTELGVGCIKSCVPYCLKSKKTTK